MKVWKKTIVAFATFALLFNSLTAPLSVLAQEMDSTPLTTSPTAQPTDTPNPTDTPTPEATASTPSIDSGLSSPTASPTAQPDATPAEIATPIASPEPTAEAGTPTPSQWTFENVELNKEYQNGGVTLTFTKLPDPSGNIKIEEITLTEEQIQQTGSLSDKAYDITSDMKDGSFSYNLSLPIPESSKGKAVEVKFAEEISNIGSAEKVENTLTKTDTSVSVTSLDHFTVFVVTDQTPTAPLSSPDTSAEPRYISGFGLDNNYTIFYEDRNVPCDGAYRIYFNQTTSGPLGLSATGTATNICDTHFTVKDWPITIDTVTYAYRAWGSGTNSGTHNFYVSNDLVNWTLATTFTFDHSSDGIIYGFHDIVQLNGNYIGWVESAGSNTYIASSVNGDGNWTVGAQVGGATAGAAPLSLYFSPGITGPKPSGNFVLIELDGQLTYAKLYLAGDYSGAYMAINRAAAQAATPALAEAAFMNPADWTWRDWTWRDGTSGLPGLADTVIANTKASGGHDVREGWTVPTSDYQSDYVFLYSADYSTGAKKGLGYLTMPGLTPADEDLILGSNIAGDANLPDGVTDVVLDNDSGLDLSAGLEDNAVTLQSGIEGTPIVLTNSDLSGVSVSIPDGTLITGPAGWDGIITPPKDAPSDGTAPSGFSVGDFVIEIGSPQGTLTFDKAVTIVLPGVTGTVGYRPSGSNTWQTITNVCTGTYENPTGAVYPGECAKNNGTDTKIVTFHFTSFGDLDTDVCPNIDGAQGGVPDGMHLDASGLNCVNFSQAGPPPQGPYTPPGQVLGITSNSFNNWPKLAYAGTSEAVEATEGVLGTETQASPAPEVLATSDQPEKVGLIKWVLTHKKISGGVSLLLLLIAYALYRSSKKKK